MTWFARTKDGSRLSGEDGDKLINAVGEYENVVSLQIRREGKPIMECNHLGQFLLFGDTCITIKVRGNKLGIKRVLCARVPIGTEKAADICGEGIAVICEDGRGGKKAIGFKYNYDTKEISLHREVLQ